MAMTIATVITMTMLLPVALIVTLLLRRHQYKKLAFSGLAKQKLQKNSTKLKQNNDDKHGICDTFAKKHQKTITYNLKKKTCCETWSYSRKPHQLEISGS